MLDSIRRLGQTANGRIDALVLAAYGEPGREAFRELLDVPVVDITDAAAHYALRVAPRYGVLTSLQRTAVRITDSLRAAPESGGGPLVVAGRRLLDLDAEALVLGCAGLAGAADDLSVQLCVAVIDPVADGVALAESLVRLGLHTSRVHVRRARGQAAARLGYRRTGRCAMTVLPNDFAGRGRSASISIRDVGWSRSPARPDSS